MTRKRFCSVPGCRHLKGHPDICIFTLPKDPLRAQCWLELICLKEPHYQTIHVCEEHFEDELINKANPKAVRLDRDAIPTLNLPQSNQLDTSIYLPSGSKTNEQHETSSIKKRKNSEDALQSRNKKKTKANELIDLTEGGNQHLSQSTTELFSVKLETDPGFHLNSDSEDSAPEKDINQHASTSQETDSSATTNKNLKTVYEQTQTNFYVMKLHKIYEIIIKITTSVKAYKQLCLKLYLRFPNEYKTLFKAIHALHPSELKDVFNDSFITTDRLGLFHLYFNLKASSMTTEQKECFICIGEYKIKPRFYYDTKKDYLLGIHDFDQELKPEPATTAVVLIMQGIFEQWKQPISVAYLANNSPPIKSWLVKNIKVVTDMGFNVRAVVPHRDTNYITDNFNVKNINNCFYDMSSLFISLYYHFTKFNLVNTSDDKNFVSCQYIVDCLILEKTKSNHSLMSKLTDNLLKPASIQELNIESVMNVFSMTTAAAISANIDSKVLDETAKETVEFIAKMSKLYDILSPVYMGDKKKKGFVGDQSEIGYLKNMYKLLSSLNLNTSSNTYRKSYELLIVKFKISIMSVLALLKTLKKNNYDHLPIWRFTDDAVDLFYDHVKKHSKSITKPTAKDVNSIFKQTAVVHLLKNHAKKIKPNDLEIVLTEFYKIVKNFKVLNDDYANHELVTNCNISSSEYMTLDMERKDGIIFLAGWLLKKAGDIHRCSFNGKNTYNLEALVISESIMPDVKKNICALPGSDFIEFVETMEIFFRTFMNNEVLCAPNKRIINGLLKNLETVDVRLPCSCFPVLYVKKLFMRFRIYYTLKYNNELLKTKLRKRMIVNKL